MNWTKICYTATNLRLITSILKETRKERLDSKRNQKRTSNRQQDMNKQLVRSRNRYKNQIKGVIGRQLKKSKWITWKEEEEENWETEIERRRWEEWGGFERCEKKTPMRKVWNRGNQTKCQPYPTTVHHTFQICRLFQ